MNHDKIIISGTGCALADYLYSNISFISDSFKKFLSVEPGDGGLSPGKLVFTNDIEKFAGIPYQAIVLEIIGDRDADAFNIGGPSMVSLIHTAQMLEINDYEVRFFGISGNDETAMRIRSMLNHIPIKIDNYLSTDGNTTPFTHVLSDPNFCSGQGERTFINNIGAAGYYTKEMLGDCFFESDIVCFGGTALLPEIHDNLTGLLYKARKQGCITVVNTVFDFRNERKNRGQGWPLVTTKKDFELIDLLIMDREEALRISGERTIDKATAFFSSSGVSAFVITNGADDLIAQSRGGLFKNTLMLRLPVSERITQDLKTYPAKNGDTTGCGDNLAGGVIASVAWQLKNCKTGELDLLEALSWGIASGGFCCFTVGGTYIESYPGDKYSKILPIQSAYLKQVGYLR